MVVPSLKTTDPLGDPAPGKLTSTVAVNVIGSPYVDPEGALLTRFVEVEALLTVTLAVPVFKEFVPVTVCEPGADGVHVAPKQAPSGLMVNVVDVVTSPASLL